MKHIPVAVSLLLCEQVIIEEQSRNVTPINCFSRRDVERIPSSALPFTVFGLLTDGSGVISFSLIISRLVDLVDIYQRSFSAQFAHPLQIVRLMLRIQDCSFASAGQYQVTLFAEREVVA